MKKSTFFWVSYSDLLTSLFFIMLVLYVATTTMLVIEKGRMEAEAKQLEEIRNVEQALSELDSRYFNYSENNKRYYLNIDINFPANRTSITFIDNEKQELLISAGQELYKTIEEVIKENPKISYLLVIEGNTQRNSRNYLDYPDVGYTYSYKRALSLYNLWLNNGINFRSFGKQCEIIIAGSGYFGQSRDLKVEENNRRFTIQITSKIGELINKDLK